MPIDPDDFDKPGPAVTPRPIILPSPPPPPEHWAASDRTGKSSLVYDTASKHCGLVFDCR